jgi:uncharacterized protein YkwD
MSKSELSMTLACAAAARVESARSETFLDRARRIWLEPGSSQGQARPIGLLMKLSLMVFLISSTLAAHAAACPDDPSWKARLLDQINSLRASGGTCANEGRFGPGAPVSWNSALETVAAAQSIWMAERGELLHVGRAGEGLGERARQADYRYERVAENIAMGFIEIGQVIEAWRQSAKHCVNLLDPRFTEVALACVRAPNGPWWTITLGRPNTRVQHAQATRVSWRSQ